MLRPLRSCRCRRVGFTLVELLVVLVVIGLLVSLVTVVASRAIGQQKIRNTQQIMQNVTLALDQFATENPLRAIYDRKGRATFGKYPPYQLANAGTSGSVPQALEPDHMLTPGANDVPDTIQERLAWDMSGSSAGITLDDWVLVPQAGDGNDDIRALSAYLKVFSPRTMELIREDRMKPINPRSRDYVNPMGNGTTPGDSGLEDILAIHDAWGVPLDYMLYVKCEYYDYGGGDQGFRITERRPVLRSRGVKREVYDAWVQSDPEPRNRAAHLSPPDKWIFSEDLPRPWAVVDEEGVFLAADPTSNGWVRAVGLNEDYAYRPDGDGREP